MRNPEFEPPFCVKCGASAYVCEAVTATGAVPSCCPNCTHARPGATTTLRLTKLGEFVRLHSVSTNLNFWRDIFASAQVVADEDGDLDFFFEEKINGLTEMRDNFYHLTAGEDD